ncbi:alpha/beta fold hydrolase [Erythrobacter sp. F6033]|uniref:alpha/beta hydrolase family protein n=1 Tax=Erythrobacter sp. F6033 TaxID=2926401 RepID=UPI001FF50AEE|nr:alpha/beta fold hydrolase [Erythrobacter sp. F6033]MCK0127986.1 alpha/beta fold hydrolase [Erythrobacter sp. F6033]
MRFLRYCLAVTAILASPLAAQEGPSSGAAETEKGTAEPGLSEIAPAEIAVESFAGRSRFWGAKLSPDGTKMSFMRRREGVIEFVISDIDTKKIVRAFGVNKNDEIEWYRWATDDKLLISLSSMGEFFGEEVRFTRLLLTQLSTGSLDYLFGKTGVVEGDNVIHVAKDGSHILVAMQKSVYDYPSVLRHELKPDGKVETVQKPREGVWNWVADDQGVVRMGTGWARKRLRIYYRENADAKLKVIAKLKGNDDEDGYWDALQIVSGSDEGYVLSENENGRVGLRRFNFATREEVETVYENPNWDIDRATIRDGKPFAAFYTADRDEVHWFDEATAKQYKALRKALGDVEIWIVSRSKDHSRMLVWAGSESDPGVLYLFSPGEKTMSQIAEYRPKLDFTQLAKPKPVSFKARDGWDIKGYLTLPRGREAKDLPLIIMPHGGPYGIRDKLTFNDEVQLLANRGYAVLQPNFRGSGGYGDEFFELGKGQIGRGMQDDLDDAMDWAVKEGFADSGRVCVVGASYGGYAAIWAVLRNPERYRCAASWAGVTDWDRILRYDRQFFGRSGFKRWRTRIRGEGQKDMKDVSPYRLAERLNRPLLLAHGTEDQVVPFKQFKQFEKATRKAPMKPTTLVIEDEGHSFAKPESEKAWYDALMKFLNEHNPADAVVRAEASDEPASTTAAP